MSSRKTATALRLAHGLSNGIYLRGDRIRYDASCDDELGVRPASPCSVIDASSLQCNMSHKI